MNESLFMEAWHRRPGDVIFGVVFLVGWCWLVYTRIVRK